MFPVLISYICVSNVSSNFFKEQLLDCKFILLTFGKKVDYDINIKEMCVGVDDVILLMKL